jgi:predicted  nucleic acid-binding Zn-ribbon protein
MAADQVERFMELKKQADSFNQNKIRIEERLRNERQNLEQLVKEINAKGFDPAKLSEIKEKLEQDLKLDLENFERLMTETTEKIKVLEGQLG